MIVSPFRVGIIFGTLLGLWHAIWAVLVAFGLAQLLIDFILYLHFIDLPLKIEPFELVRAGLLVGVTFVIGFFAGAIGGWLWNALHPPGA